MPSVKEAGLSFLAAFQRRRVAEVKSPRLREAELRHARHYLDRLHQAAECYKQQGELIRRGRAMFDLEWDNIQIGQAWAKANARGNSTAAQLCSDYVETGNNLLTAYRHPREHIGWLEPALIATEYLNDHPSYRNHLRELGSVYERIGDDEKSLECCQRSLAVDRAIGDRRGEGKDLGRLAVAHAHLGDARQAIESGLQGLTIIRGICTTARSKHEWTAARQDESAALNILGEVYFMLYESKQAVDYHWQALSIDRETDNHRNERATLGLLSIAYADSGKVGAAIECSRQVLAIDRETGDHQNETATLCNLGNLYSQSGNRQQAIECYTQALTIIRESGHKMVEGTLLWNLADEYHKIGDRDKAIAYAEASLKIKEQIEDIYADRVRKQLAEWRK